MYSRESSTVAATGFESATIFSDSGRNVRRYVELHSVREGDDVKEWEGHLERASEREVGDEQHKKREVEKARHASHSKQWTMQYGESIYGVSDGTTITYFLISNNDETKSNRFL